MSSTPPSVPELLRREAAVLRDVDDNASLADQREALRHAALLEAAADIEANIRVHGATFALNSFDRRVREVLTP